MTITNYAEEARDVRESHWNNDGVIPFPINPFVIAHSLGIQVSYSLLDAKTAGFILREDNGETKVVLNVNDSVARQRFTLAHEIGHFVQHREKPSMGFVDHRDELASSGRSRHEIWANRFAAELLMPATIVKKWWAEGRSPREMRDAFSVSEQSFAIRLATLGLLSD